MNIKPGMMCLIAKSPFPENNGRIVIAEQYLGTNITYQGMPLKPSVNQMIGFWQISEQVKVQISFFKNGIANTVFSHEYWAREDYLVPLDYDEDNENSEEKELELENC